MKLFALLLFLLPVAVTAQTKTDYEHAMAKFQRFYNAGQGDSICAMFPTEGIKFLWNNDSTESTLQRFGTLKSFKFIGIDKSDPQRVRVFKTVFSKAGTKTTSLTTYKNKQLGTFRFMTESDGIAELLRKDKSK